jgi:hypothetical protein
MSKTASLVITIGAMLLLPFAGQALPAPGGMKRSAGEQSSRAAGTQTRVEQGKVFFYLGGRNTKNALTTLYPKTASQWVRQQLSQGLSLVPLWVGPQPSCTKGYSTYIASTSRNKAREQGEDSADAAVSAASSLGLGKGTLLYYEMGNYNQANSSCQGAVGAFLSGWDYEIHSFGYKAGVYTDAASAKADHKDLRILAPELEPDVILVAK